MNHIKNIKALIQYSADGIFSKKLFKHGNLDVTLFCMAKDTEMSEHTSTKEGTIYVLEGKGIFRLEGEDIEMNPGALIHLKRNAGHSLKAKKDTSFILSLHA